MASLWGCGDLLWGGSPLDLLWTTDVATPRITTATAADEALFYVLTEDGPVALGRGNGSVAWAAGREQAPNNAAVADGRVFLADLAVIARDAATGEELWRAPLPDRATFGEVSADEHGVYVTTRTPTVHAFDAETGAELWSVKPSGDWPYGGVGRGTAASGDTVYAGFRVFYSETFHLSTGRLIAYDRSTGEELWRWENGDGSDMRDLMAAPAVANRFVLVVDRQSNSVIAVDRFTGEEAWRVWGEAGWIGFSHPPIVRGDTVFAGSGDKWVYAIDLHTGELRWKSDRISGSIDSIALCGDAIFVSGFDFTILDRATGRIVVAPEETGIDEALALVRLVVHDGQALVLTRTGTAYSYRCPEF